MLTPREGSKALLDLWMEQIQVSDHLSRRARKIGLLDSNFEFQTIDVNKAFRKGQLELPKLAKYTDAAETSPLISPTNRLSNLRFISHPAPDILQLTQFKPAALLSKPPKLHSERKRLKYV